MFAIISNGAIAMLVAPGTPFTWDGLQYPANWCNFSTPDQKAAIGMVDVIYAQQPNDQYYWVTQNEPVYDPLRNVVNITYTATPKDLDGLKASQISTTNSTAYSILLPTDWMVVKAVETGGTVAPDWNTWRQEIRVQASDRRDVIMACNTVDQLAALPPVQWAHDPNYVGV